MAEYLPFWPKAAVGAYLANGGDAYIFSRALPTNGFTEVVVELGIDANFGNKVATYVEAIPESSNDGINWEQQASGTFSLAATGTFPKQKVEKYTEVGAFMRIRIKIHNGESIAAYLAPTVFVAGAGRS